MAWQDKVSYTKQKADFFMQIYVVKEGDDVDLIANSFGVPAETIIYDNQLIYPYKLAVGQSLLINDGVTETERREAVIRGFAYPFISRYVLTQTLPSLSELAIFSYGFTESGELVFPLLDDSELIQLSYQYDVKPILTLTPLGADGRFNNNLISAVVNNEQVTENLINNLLNIMNLKGYQGLDIDFEYIKAEDRQAFVDFVALVTERMNSNGYSVSVDLAPKTSANQQGLLYEGKDYAALGALANSVLVMTYEWGYTFGPPMAVAPINKVRQVLEYAVTEIPSEKINMGIPNYGYDWPLPYESGVTKAKTIGNIEAVQIAIQYGAQIYYDEVAQTPYFNYVDSGVTHEVWFEDARSLQAKMELVGEYNLRGISYWQIMQLLRLNWLLVENNFLVVK